MSENNLQIIVYPNQSVLQTNNIISTVIIYLKKWEKIDNQQKNQK